MDIIASTSRITSFDFAKRSRSGTKNYIVKHSGLSFLSLLRKFQNFLKKNVEKENLWGLICNESTVCSRITNESRKKYGKMDDDKMLKEYLKNGKLYSGHEYLTKKLKQKNIQVNTEGKSLQDTCQIICQIVQKN